MRRIHIRNCLAIATMDDARTEWRGEDILLRGNVIEAVGPAVRAALAADPHVTEVIDGRHFVALPGFVNTHHHLIQTLTRAFPAAQDAKLFDWLVTLYRVWREMTPEALHVGALVGLGELLLTGCTSSSDHSYLVPASGPEDILDETIRAAQELGIRFHPTRGSMSLGVSKGGLPPDDCVQDEDTILRDCERMMDRWHDPAPLSMCRVGLGPCAPFTVTEALMRETAVLARQRGVRLHTHLAETLDEDDFCLSRYGKRPLEFMESLDWVGSDVWFAHGIHFNDAEIQRLASAQAGIASCPASNLRLGSGTCRIVDLRAAGVPVGLGVDGSASNDSSNMMREVQLAMLVQRGRYGVDRMPAREALWLATRGGASLLGRDDIGRLEAGKAADVVLFDVEEIGFAGAMHDPIAALVFCGTSGRVHTSFVDGRAVVRERRLLATDETEVFRRAGRLAAGMVERAANRPPG